MSEKICASIQSFAARYLFAALRINVSVSWRSRKKLCSEWIAEHGPDVQGSFFEKVFEAV